jgi:hypothetical protein
MFTSGWTMIAKYVLVKNSPDDVMSIFSSVGMLTTHPERSGDTFGRSGEEFRAAG